MKPTSYLLIAGMLALTACGSSHRPVYSGHQESTEGVPGFKNGKKVSPHVKLGQSYSVDGETYVPKYEPGYVEEGMASWYGPGFHGGKTANGEAFDTHALTAAHRTLPLPSMVKVTLLSTGKSVIVRVNDRGPFSKNRIIDLSQAAAKEIGLIGKGTGKVRVEYLGRETERFTQLLEQGRSPDEIDIATEVLVPTGAVYASNTAITPRYTSPQTSWASRLNPISSAQAQEVSNETSDGIETMDVTASDLAAPVSLPPSTASVTTVKPATVSPFAAIEAASTAPANTNTPVVESISTPRITSTSGYYLQLGAFANEMNAKNLSEKVKALGKVSIEPKSMPDSGVLYVVRLGPYTDVDESTRVLAELNGLGINPKTVSK